MGKHQWKNAVVIITGGGTGIGRCLGLQLAKRGCRLAVVGRRPVPLMEVVGEITALGGEALAIPADVRDPRAAEDIVAKVISRFQTIDILVNNAGELLRKDIADESFENFEHLIRNNYLSAVRLTKAVLPLFREKRQGMIVNVSSILGRIAVRGSAAYAASKFALSGFTDALRLEERRNGIHVVEVNPGLVATAMTEVFSRDDPAARRRAISPEQVAAAMVRGMEKRRTMVAIPWYVHPVITARWVAPRLMNWLLETFS